MAGHCGRGVSLRRNESWVVLCRRLSTGKDENRAQTRSGRSGTDLNREALIRFYEPLIAMVELGVIRASHAWKFESRNMLANTSSFLAVSEAISTELPQNSSVFKSVSS